MNTPSSWSEVTVWHTVVYYTFLPVVFVMLFGTLSTPVLWYFSVLGFGQALAIPWILCSLTIVYVALLGNYVMPAETYRKYRSGEWGT